MESSPSFLNFSKYAGAGNDFILIDNRTRFFLANPSLIRKLCHRQLGIGADGVILLEPEVVADFGFRIFNSDGSEAEMCGNGVRCFALFIKELGVDLPQFRLKTKERILQVSFAQEEVMVAMGEPTDLRLHIDKNIHHVNTGVPHAVQFFDDISAIDVEAEGRKLRNDPRFSPHGVNVNFVRMHPEGHLEVRTYERGVEGETLACGTGATAAAFIASQLYSLCDPIKVHTRSKEVVTVFTKGEVRMQGPAKKIFSGTIPINSIG